MTAEEIVRKLTKAQREAMMRRPQSYDDQIWAYANTMRVLERLGLITGRIGWTWRGALSPLGLEVRRLLENTHD